ncbi:MAG: divalent-cation tolerance protein CutA [Candidatus Aenigmarchaeota archaeon]|nr:divalent-cation tolerance protein CutA [Candidatus Aenigmarchaeota archaeon]
MRLIYITTSNVKEAEKIAKALVKEKLVACVNIFPIKSIYRWKGKTERTNEIGMFAKTKNNLVNEVIKRVKELHSYEVPCIITFPIEKGYDKFLKWISEVTK